MGLIGNACIAEQDFLWKKKKAYKKWIECDSYKKQLYSSCMPKLFKQSINYDSEDSFEEVELFFAKCATNEFKEF